MDERDLTQAFRAAFDGHRPTAGAVDRAFAAVAAAEPPGAYTMGRRLAGAAAVALALLVVATLLIARGALASRPVTMPAARPIATPAAASTDGPLGVAAGSVNQPPAALVAALSDHVVMAGWSGAGRVQLTTDGGVTWAALRVPLGVLFDLQWIDNDTMLASTDAGLYSYQRSTAAWTRMSPRGDLVRLDFRDRSLGYAVTAGGDVVETQDGGGTLSAVDVGIHPVTWLQWVSGTHAWAAGPGGVAATSDGGATWVQQLTFPVVAGQPGAVTRVQVGFRDETNGFAIVTYDGGASPGFVVYHTADAGASWTAQSCTCGGASAPDWLPSTVLKTLPYAYSDLVVTGGSSAMLVGNDPRVGTASLCVTTDSGRGWSCDPVPYEGGTATALAVRGESRWLVGRVGSSGQLLASSPDAGATWTVRRP